MDFSQNKQKEEKICLYNSMGKNKILKKNGISFIKAKLIPPIYTTKEIRNLQINTMLPVPLIHK